MPKHFDSIDIFFIVLITTYLMTLMLFLLVLIDKKQFNQKKVIKNNPNNLIKVEHYKQYVSYPTNNFN